MNDANEKTAVVGTATKPKAEKNLAGLVPYHDKNKYRFSIKKVWEQFNYAHRSESHSILRAEFFTVFYNYWDKVVQKGTFPQLDEVITELVPKILVVFKKSFQQSNDEYRGKYNPVWCEEHAVKWTTECYNIVYHRSAAERQKREEAARPWKEQAPARKLALKASGIIGSSEFSERVPPSWLVEGVFVEKQPGIVGGPMKTLKTSVGLDLAVSLATQTPFLGKFSVPKARKVLFISAESGDADILHTENRIRDGRWLTNRPDLLFYSFRPVLINTDKGLRKLRWWIRQLGVEVVILDPLNLLVDDTFDPANMFKVGRILRRFTRVCLNAGATPILIHHSDKGLLPGKPMKLSNLVYAGVAEWTRQWLLVNRRTGYQEDGKHELIVVAGGSAGHSSSWAVTVDEGPLGTDSRRTLWQTEIAPYRTPPTKGKNATDAGGAAAPSNRTGQLADRLLTALDAVLQQVGGDADYTAVKKAAGLNSDNMKRAVAYLSSEAVKKIEVVSVTGKNKKTKQLLRRIV